MKRILVSREACSGCRACEVACVAHHEGRFGTAAARIHVVKVEALGIDQPHVCRQCGSTASAGATQAVALAPCVAACPVGALSKDERTGAIQVDMDPVSAQRNLNAIALYQMLSSTSICGIIGV